MSNVIDVSTDILGSIFGACFMSMPTPSHSRFQVLESQEHSIGLTLPKVVLSIPPTHHASPLPSSTFPITASADSAASTVSATIAASSSL